MKKFLKICKKVLDSGKKVVHKRTSLIEKSESFRKGQEFFTIGKMVDTMQVDRESFRSWQGLEAVFEKELTIQNPGGLRGRIFDN